MSDQLLNNIDHLSRVIKAGELDQNILAKARAENGWFTATSVERALNAIAQEYLNIEKLKSWKSAYPKPRSRKKVGLVLAGNIPAVGFHDVLCGIVSGHELQIKLSSKDRVLIPYLVDQIAPDQDQIQYVERLNNSEVIIATGTDSGVDHYRKYLGHLPHIFRGHRNAVAVLSGEETEGELRALMDDIFIFFGLGCRNVSKLLVPSGYDFTRFLKMAEDTYKDVIHHNKYANNYDYNKTLLLMNKVPHHSAWNLLLTEDESLHSRIACLHYETYSDTRSLLDTLSRDKGGIQCVVSSMDIDQWQTVDFGEAQNPSLTDYADNVDTMAFLTQLP